MVYLIYVFAGILSVFAPKAFIIFYCFFGCELDAFGVTSYLKQIVPYYSEIMHLLLFMCVCVSLVRNREVLGDRLIRLSFLYMATMSLSVVFGLLAYNYEGNVLYRIVYASTTFGPAIFVVWRGESIYKRRKQNTEHEIGYAFLLVLELVLALLVVYSDKYNIGILKAINGINYAEDGYIYSLYNRSPAKLYNFYEVFFYRARFLATGQFHNSNALGFCSGMAMIYSLERVTESSNKKGKAAWIIICLLGGYVWCSAGTRGALLAVIIYAVYLLLSQNKIGIKRVISTTFVVFLLLLAFVLFGQMIFSYLLGSGAAQSFYSRTTPLPREFQYFVEHPLIGSGGEAVELRIQGIDPHVLPLKVATLYGVIPSILIIVIVYVYPIKRILSMQKGLQKKNALGLLIGVWLISITDNMALTGLFWVTLAEASLYFIGEKQDENKERIIHY